MSTSEPVQAQELVDGDNDTSRAAPAPDKSPTKSPKNRRRRTVATLVVVIALLGIWVLTAWGQRTLVLGVDERAGDVGRSDVLLVISPRPLAGGLTMLSIPRDTRVEIPGHQQTKINAAFAFGGTDLAVQTTEKFLDLTVNHYVRLNFEAVRSVVDALGGVTIDVTERMKYSDPYQDLVIDLQPGIQRLDGEQALGFARFRGDPQGDIARVQRQRILLRTIVLDLVRPSGWLRVPAVYHAFRSHVDTDLSALGLFRMGFAWGFSALLGINGETVPGRNATVAGASYWLADSDATRQLTRRLFGVR